MIAKLEPLYDGCEVFPDGVDVEVKTLDFKYKGGIWTTFEPSDIDPNFVAYMSGLGYAWFDSMTDSSPTPKKNWSMTWRMVHLNSPSLVIDLEIESFDDELEEWHRYEVEWKDE